MVAARCSRAPSQVGDFGEASLPDGVGLVDRGDGLWTAMERTLSTCDVEITQAVVAAIPARAAL
ncbi:hypothetical protein [Nannocystis pusilla]|uniref:hypothetical protein n=1 Tax=Nannocystis pusilla TaxID=889268 RepID=UPI003B8218D7